MLPGMMPCCALARVKIMHGHINIKNGQKAPLVADDVYEIITQVCSGSTCENGIQTYYQMCQGIVT